jgi:hypothetical protein
MVQSPSFLRLVRRLCDPTALLLVGVLCLSGFSTAKDVTKLLPQHYRDWLTKEVTYIISNQE